MLPNQGVPRWQEAVEKRRHSWHRIVHRINARLEELQLILVTLLLFVDESCFIHRVRDTVGP